MTVGRPTDYHDGRGQELIDWMAKGYSLTAAAGGMGVSRPTVYRWGEEHPEFRDAMDKARAKRLIFLETDMLDRRLPAPAMTARIFACKNADAHEWMSDKRLEGEAEEARGPQIIVIGNGKGDQVEVKSS